MNKEEEGHLKSHCKRIIELVENWILSQRLDIQLIHLDKAMQLSERDESHYCAMELRGVRHDLLITNEELKKLYRDIEDLNDKLIGNFECLKEFKEERLRNWREDE